MWLTQLLSLIPTIIVGVEKIHGGVKDGKSKKQLALEALGLAVTGATGLVPSQLQPAIGAAQDLAGTVIDKTVELFNKIGWPHKDVPAALPESARHWTVIRK